MRGRRRGESEEEKGGWDREEERVGEGAAAKCTGKATRHKGCDSGSLKEGCGIEWSASSRGTELRE